MKIIHVEDRFEPQAGYQINELIKVQAKQGDKVIVITSQNPIFSDKSKLKEGDLVLKNKYDIDVIRLDYYAVISSRYLFKGLFKTIDNLNPDVVFLHGIGDFKDLILFGKAPKYTIVRDCHMSWVASKNKFANIYYKFFKLFFSKIINKKDIYSKVFALGVEEAEYLDVLGINSEKVDFLYHGYNSDVMYYDFKGRNEVRSEYGFNEDDIVISYIGKFDFNKRPDLIIDILNELSGSLIEKKNIKLLLIGSKNLKFMSLFDEKINNLKKEIKFIIDDSKKFESLRKYFSASDICIFPKETTLSSIHAQVCRCPVIMENHYSNKERVIENKNLYDIDNIKEASNILERIIVNREYDKENNAKYDNILRNRDYKVQISKLYNSVKMEKR